MEMKLTRAAALLPEPKLDFQTIEQQLKITAKPQRKTGKALRAALAAVLVAMLLCGMGWAKLQYSMWSLGSSNAYSDLENAAEQYGIVLPESLDGALFRGYYIYGMVPQNAPWITALLNPSYKPQSITYGSKMREILLPHSYGEFIKRETIRKEPDLKLNFGTTKNDLWRYFFNYDENGLWTGCEVPESYEVIEYKGITLQIGDTFHYDEAVGSNLYVRWVHWVDAEKQVVFSIHETDYSDPDRVVECAKLIIDLNS